MKFCNHDVSIDAYTRVCRIYTWNTYSSDISLLCPSIHHSVDGRSSIALNRRRSTLASEVHIDGEELVLAIERLPRGSQRLPAASPSRVERVDTAWVVLELGTWEDNVCLSSISRIGFAETKSAWLVEIGGADIAAWLTTILAIDWADVDECVLDTTDGGDCTGEGGEGKVGVND
jgi:hypothetical protein